MIARRDVLAEILHALQQAADRLRATHAGVSQLFPLTADRIAELPSSEQERLDAYAIRYARCRDMLFPAMRALARTQLEPKADRGLDRLASPSPNRMAQPRC